MKKQTERLIQDLKIKGLLPQDFVVLAQDNDEIKRKNKTGPIVLTVLGLSAAGVLLLSFGRSKKRKEPVLVDIETVYTPAQGRAIKRLDFEYGPPELSMPGAYIDMDGGSWVAWDQPFFNNVNYVLDIERNREVPSILKTSAALKVNGSTLTQFAGDEALRVVAQQTGKAGKTALCLAPAAVGFVFSFMAIAFAVIGFFARKAARRKAAEQEQRLKYNLAFYQQYLLAMNVPIATAVEVIKGKLTPYTAELDAELLAGLNSRWMRLQATLDSVHSSANNAERLLKHDDFISSQVEFNNLIKFVRDTKAQAGLGSVSLESSSDAHAVALSNSSEALALLKDGVRYDNQIDEYALEIIETTPTWIFQRINLLNVRSSFGLQKVPSKEGFSYTLMPGPAATYQVSYDNPDTYVDGIKPKTATIGRATSMAYSIYAERDMLGDTTNKSTLNSFNVEGRTAAVELTVNGFQGSNLITRRIEPEQNSLLLGVPTLVDSEQLAAGFKFRTADNTYADFILNKDGAAVGIPLRVSARGPVLLQEIQSDESVPVLGVTELQVMIMQRCMISQGPLKLLACLMEKAGQIKLSLLELLFTLEHKYSTSFIFGVVPEFTNSSTTTVDFGSEVKNKSYSISHVRPVLIILDKVKQEPVDVSQWNAESLPQEVLHQDSIFLKNPESLAKNTWDNVKKDIEQMLTEFGDQLEEEGFGQILCVLTWLLKLNEKPKVLLNTTFTSVGALNWLNHLQLGGRNLKNIPYKTVGGTNVNVSWTGDASLAIGNVLIRPEFNAENYLDPSTDPSVITSCYEFFGFTFATEEHEVETIHPVWSRGVAGFMPTQLLNPIGTEIANLDCTHDIEVAKTTIGKGTLMTLRTKQSQVGAFVQSFPLDMTNFSKLYALNSLASTYDKLFYGSGSKMLVPSLIPSFKVKPLTMLTTAWTWKGCNPYGLDHKNAIEVAQFEEFLQLPLYGSASLFYTLLKEDKLAMCIQDGQKKIQELREGNSFAEHIFGQVLNYGSSLFHYNFSMIGSGSFEIKSEQITPGRSKDGFYFTEAGRQYWMTPSAPYYIEPTAQRSFISLNGQRLKLPNKTITFEQLHIALYGLSNQPFSTPIEQKGSGFFSYEYIDNEGFVHLFDKYSRDYIFTEDVLYGVET